MPDHNTASPTESWRWEHLGLVPNPEELLFITLQNRRLWSEGGLVWFDLVVLTELDILKWCHAVLYVTGDGIDGSRLQWHMALPLHHDFYFAQSSSDGTFLDPALEGSTFSDMCWRFISGFKPALDLKPFTEELQKREQRLNVRSQCWYLAGIKELWTGQGCDAFVYLFSTFQSSLLPGEWKMGCS